MQKLKKGLVITGLAVAGFVGIYATSARNNLFEVAKNLEIFATLYRDINMYYVDETQPGELMRVGIDAMLTSLDPYTTYITESRIEDYRFMTTGEYGGIGSLIRSIDGKVYISEPYEGFPAQKGGLKAGDLILAIDGKSVEGKNQEEISQLLKGQSGSTLTLTYERQGETHDVTLKREEIKIPDVPYYGMLTDSIGYINLNSFTRTASAEVRKAFLELRDEKGMKALVFDLRGNGGGLLNEAVRITNFFVPKGQTVVQTKGKIPEWDRTHVAPDNPLDLEIPLVILVDGGSASASEIVAGAVQDLDRGVLIGNRTFGKGLVQETKDLKYNNKLKLTVAKYYIPSGRCIQKLDYSHRTADGDVEEVPDSLLKVFYTKAGRKVMDGRGLMPDIRIEEKEIPHVIMSLLSESLFFKYAGKYAAEHDTIPAPETFQLSDEEYKAFTEFLNTQNYSYTTDTETALESLISVAQKEKYYGLAESEFEELLDALHGKKNKDVEIFRDDIRLILENEIVSRYYYQEGRIRAALAEDESVLEAKAVLSDPARYAEILSPPKK